MALALGFIWLFGAARPASPPAPTATPQPVVVSRPTAPPPTATQPPPTATPAAPTATPAPTPTRVPPTATRPPAAPTAPPTPAVARVAVPKLVGLSLGAAQSALGDRNLIMGFQNGSDPSQPDGVVLEQNPKEGEMVAPRSTVQVVVNKLPAAGLVTVPNVMGMEQDAARKTLEQAGLKVSVGQKSGGHKGSVDDQSPEGGQKVPPGSEVKITIGS